MSAFFSSCRDRAVVRRERDADAGADDDLVAVDLVGRADHLDEPARRARATASLGPVPTCTMANSSPPSRATVSLSRDASRQPARDLLQQLVADRMAERVVDALEMVEIEAQHRQPARCA